jgi:hypothetical protein
MKRLHLLALAAFAASAPAFADDVDVLPYGYVSSVIRSTQADKTQIVRPAASVGEAGAVSTVVVATKSRAQVAAETREAARLGLLNYGEAGPVQPTSEQAHQVEQAGQRAVAVDFASK